MIETQQLYKCLGAWPVVSNKETVDSMCEKNESASNILLDDPDLPHELTHLSV